VLHRPVELAALTGELKLAPIPMSGKATSMIGLCQEGKSSPGALWRSAGGNPFRFFAACVGLSASVPHDGEPDLSGKWT